jgi:hypothetical protein
VSSIIAETDDFKEGEFGILWCKECKEGEHTHCIFKGSMQLLFIFISPTLSLNESVQTISVSSIIAEIGNLKEGEFAISLCKTAKKVSMLIVYLGD